MDTLRLVVQLLTLAGVVAVVALQLRALASPSDGLPPRARRRVAYARHAVAYAKALGGTPEAQLRAALGHFALLDEADNGKRDYTEAEARLAIESIRGGA